MSTPTPASSITNSTTDIDTIQNPETLSIRILIRMLRRDPSGQGCLSLGGDGVLRTLTASRTVVDAIALSPAQILQHLNTLPWDQSIENKFRGVDGWKTPREQWFSPKEGVLPPRREEEGEERRKERRHIIERQKEDYRKMVESGGSKGQCDIKVSEYDLRPRNDDTGE